MKYILSIDGGGMKGYIPMAILAELEKRAGKACHEIFDLGAGTSIGGISIGLLGAGISGANAISFFTEDGPRIFAKSWRTMTAGLFGPKYPAAPLEAALQAKLGDLKFSQSRISLLITSLDLVSQDPYFFKASTATEPCKDWLIWEAARATSAAQTYFPAYETTDGTRNLILWDGGNVANNPALCAYAEAKKLWPGEEVTILSIGCGDQQADISATGLLNGSLLKSGLATVELLFEAGSEDVDYQMEQLIGTHYIRWNPKLRVPLSIDGAAPEDLIALASEASNAVNVFSVAMDQFVASLKQ